MLLSSFFSTIQYRFTKFVRFMFKCCVFLFAFVHSFIAINHIINTHSRNKIKWNERDSTITAFCLCAHAFAISYAHTNTHSYIYYTVLLKIAWTQLEQIQNYSEKIWQKHFSLSKNTKKNKNGLVAVIYSIFIAFSYSNCIRSIQWIFIT